MALPSFKSSLFRTAVLAIVFSILAHGNGNKPQNTDPDASPFAYKSFNLYRIPLAGMALFYSTNKPLGFNLTIIYAVLYESLASFLANFIKVPQLCKVADSMETMVGCVFQTANCIGSFFTGVCSVLVVVYYVKHPDFFRTSGSDDEGVHSDIEAGETESVGNEDVTAFHIAHVLQYSDVPTLGFAAGLLLFAHIVGLVDITSDVYAVRTTMLLYCFSRIVSETSPLVVMLVKLLGRDWEVSIHL